MKIQKTFVVTTIVLGIFATLLTSGVVWAQQGGEPRGLPTWRFEMANDSVFNSDNQFTNGFTVQKHSPAFSSLDATRGTPAFGKSLARFFLPDKEGLWYREGWAIGHNMLTPEEIEREAIILNDVPYVGMLGWANSFIAFDDRDLSGFELLLGWVGPGALAEELQEGVHSVIDSEDPEGWDNQLDDEPIINLFYTRKHKLWRKPTFDGAATFGGALGNFFSFAEVALEMRFGRMPGGFAYVPDPLGRGINLNSTLPVRGSRSQFYGTVIIRGTGFALSLPLEGNNFTDDSENS